MVDMVDMDMDVDMVDMVDWTWWATNRLIQNLARHKETPVSPNCRAKKTWPTKCKRQTLIKVSSLLRGVD